MDEAPHFEPLFPSHAIERCGAAIAFTEVLPAKPFEKVLDHARSNFRNAGLEQLGGPTPTPPGLIHQVGFQVDMSSGVATALSGPMPLIFVTPDRATQFIVSPNSLTARTGRYVRWQPFAGQLEELMLSLVGGYADIVSIANIQLDYVDRFCWTGDWRDFRWHDLLREDGSFLTRKAAAATTQWHSHTGWFEEIQGGRRLCNVNIDAADVVRPEGTVPSIAILTLMRDLALAQEGGPPRYIDGVSVQAGLEQLQNELKTLLGQIILPSMAQRIGLV
jgi:uncharacterized protein (TIGR04255 family)